MLFARKNPKKKTARPLRKIGLVVLPLCFLMVACQEAPSSEAPQEDLASYERVERTIDNTYPRLSLEELSNYSDLIVTGTFKGYGDPFRVLPYGGQEPSIFKDGVFEIDQVYKGDIKAGDEVTLRTQGGQWVDHEEETIYVDTSSEDLTLEEGAQVLLFLARPTADAYKTQEDYYKLVSGPNGLYSLSSDSFENLADPSITLNPEDLETIDPSVDPGEAQKAQMDEKLKDGSLSQEDYEAYFDQLDQYGQRQ
ncbi:MAG: hypothetical protein Q4E37_06500 [Tissierellia bacterium]|nr:hypothetical protein [Tissierellia bacterium]